MVEPHGAGFTGKVWDAVPGERLARDLTTGPGSVPTARAGVAWATIAGGLVEAAVEYESIVDVVRQAWRSSEGEAAAHRMSALAGWLGEAAASATSNALRAETQAGAYEIARLTMPDANEVAATELLKNSLLQGLMLGGALTGVSATAENAADVAKKQAARVMQTYEAATTPLATPWRQTPPPAISNATALTAERAGRERQAPSGRAAASTGGPLGEMPRLSDFETPIVESAYTGEQLAESDTAAEIDEAAAPLPVHEVGAPGAPLMAGPATGGALEEDHVVRAGLAIADQSGADRLGLDPGFATAPAVLGAAASKAAPVLPRVEQATGA